MLMTASEAGANASAQCRSTVAGERSASLARRPLGAAPCCCCCSCSCSLCFSRAPFESPSFSPPFSPLLLPSSNEVEVEKKGPGGVPVKDDPRNRRHVTPSRSIVPEMTITACMALAT
eukprot:2146575-Rhodomonas_salina.1